MEFLAEKFKAAVHKVGLPSVIQQSGVSRSALYAYMNGEKVPGSEQMAAMAVAVKEPMETFFAERTG